MPERYFVIFLESKRYYKKVVAFLFGYCRNVSLVCLATILRFYGIYHNTAVLEIERPIRKYRLEL